MRRLFLLAIFTTLALAASSDEAGRESERPADGVRFERGKRPVLVWGSLFSVDFRAKFQNDFRDYDSEVTDDAGAHELHRARIGVEGRFLKVFEFELERELSDTRNPLKDAFVNWRRYRHFQVKAGRFKAPFGMEQLTGPTQMDFAHRSGISAHLAPGRDVGVMAHGPIWNATLKFETGVFRHDGDNARVAGNVRAGGPTFVARLRATPGRRLIVPRFLKDLELGGGFATTRIPEGAYSLRGQTVANKSFFRRLEVHGQRLRLGAQLHWVFRPFKIDGEYVQVSDQRLGQGLLGDDLPDMLSRGWYLTGAWTIFDRSKAYGKGRSFFRSVYHAHPLWALELATRYEQLRFGSAGHTGAPSRSSRAANILSASNRTLTLGANLALNRYTRIQVNAVREKVEDTQRSPIPGRELFWTRLCRLQFVI
jgi:phosphate-selective porin OprO/OprP